MKILAKLWFVGLACGALYLTAKWQYDFWVHNDQGAGGVSFGFILIVVSFLAAIALTEKESK